MILLDTCALLWWTLAPDHLSQKAREACDAIPSHGALVSSISLWELGIKTQKGSLTLPIPFDEYVGRLRKLSELTLVAVDDLIWVESLALDWPHRDPADRVIVATARLHGASIITKDPIIHSFYDDVIW